jgi:iron complex outermembrane recepter protein
MRKKPRNRLHRFSRITISRLPLAAAIHFACFAPVFADTSADAGADASASADQNSPAPQSAPGDEQKTQLGTITVTAQKRTENAQDVPISIDVLSSDKLMEMNVSDFNDYAKMLPSVSTQSFSPGFSQVYMRGVASGSNGNHSGPLPSVGQYLDEQPITTIQGALDIHMYDIARVEALAGPQGTLYGASSESGTIRVITNKPDPSAFSGSATGEVNSTDHGGMGYQVEGFVNIPFAQNIALRVVGWDVKDAGYIDNVFGTRTYPTSGITIDNSSTAKNNYNTAETTGGRAALAFILNDEWTITPTVQGQSQREKGVWAFDPHVGDLEVTHFFPEESEDRWVQSALTVQGKIGNFDVVYAFAHLNRSDHVESDYSDYSYWYDVCCGYGAYITDKNGNLINPSQYIHGQDIYRKTSNELRISSPKEDRFRFTAGVFDEVQSHDIQQRYIINGLSPDLSVTGWPDTLWLTKQKRYDDDYAAFGELSYDITDRLTGTVGGRWFHTDNSLKGFFGFGSGFSSHTGESQCYLVSQQPFEGAPCTNLDKDTKETDTLGKANLTYKLDDDKMIYGLWSQGFRPGGINRKGDLPPYLADYLTNWEFGWKTEWMDHRLRWNGAVFREDWKDFQFAVLGTNGLTVIKNANSAQIDGFESNVSWAATYNLVLSSGIALYHSELTDNYCGVTDDSGNPITHCTVGDPNYPDIAPKGTELPITAKVKGNLTARYNFEVGGGWESYFQGAAFFEGRRRSDLRLLENSILGDMPGYGTVDLSVGTKKDLWSFDVYLKNAFDNRGQLLRYTECAETVCGAQTYIIPVEPRMIGIRATRDF